MFCPYCGVQYDDNFKFCPKCGKEKPQVSFAEDMKSKFHVSEKKEYEKRLIDNKPTTENIDIFVRIKAYFIDEFINIVIIVVGVIIYDNIRPNFASLRRLDFVMETFYLFLAIFSINFLYVSFFEIIYNATFGKLICDIKVVNLSNEPISIFQCFARFITKPFVGLLYPNILAFCLLGFRLPEYERMYGGPNYKQNFLILIILLSLNFLYLIFNYFYFSNNKRSISDKFLEINVVNNF